MKLYTVEKYVFQGGLITPEPDKMSLKEVTINTIRQIIGAWSVPIVRQSVSGKLVSPYLVVDLAALGFPRPGEEFSDIGKHFVTHDLDTAITTAIMYDQQRRDNSPDAVPVNLRVTAGPMTNGMVQASPMRILPKKRP